MTNTPTPMDKQPYHQEAERLAKDQVFVPEKFRPMDKQTADKNERVVVRILDNGNARTLNKLGEFPKDGFKNLNDSHTWWQQEYNCVELPFEFSENFVNPAKTFDELTKIRVWYAYRDNDHFVLIEPKTE